MATIPSDNLTESKKREAISAAANARGFECHVDEDATDLQLDAITQLVVHNSAVFMMNVPQWMQKHYLVKKSKILAEFDISGFKSMSSCDFKFVQIDPHTAFYDEKPLDIDLKSLKTPFVSNKAMQVEFDEYCGTEYYVFKHKGRFVNYIPCFQIFGVSLPKGKKWLTQL